MFPIRDRFASAAFDPKKHKLDGAVNKLKSSVFYPINYSTLLVVVTF